MVEIEYFCDSNQKDYLKFSNVADLDVVLYFVCNQMDGKFFQVWKLGEVVKQVNWGGGDFIRKEQEEDFFLICYYLNLIEIIYLINV